MATTLTAEISTPLPGEDHHHQDLLIGCILAVCGNLLISVSLNLQKFTHMKNEEREIPIHYTKNPLWWVGVVLMGLGEVGNFSAYGYAPASVVAPLGTTTVIANMFLAAIFLKEKIRAEQLFGSALAIIGAVILVAFASKKEAILDGEMLNKALTQTSFIIYVSLELVIILALLLLLYWKKMERVVIYLLITSLIASFCVISAKAVSGMIQLTFDGYSQLGYPSLYIMFVVMIVTAVLQVKYLNQAMKNFESTIVVPTNFVFFTISAIVAGIIFYKEFYGMTAIEIFMFLFGCVMSFVGVYFIVGGRGSVEVVVQAAKVEPTPVTVTTNIFQSWLLATVNVGQVQPSGHVSHLIEGESSQRRGLIQDQDTSSSQDTLYSTAESHTSPKKYGTND